ncbi:MAG: DUF695 domain-containing protein [Phycisphaerales bacterium]|jgi:hypothetical protein
MSTPADNWAVYWANVEGKAATILVDLSWRDRAPDPARPMLVEVSVPFHASGEDGFPDPDELNALDPIDDRLDAALQRGVDAVPVGCMSSDGRRRWYFYARTGECEAAVRRAFDGSGYEPTWSAKPDPDWSGYNDTLYPKPEELRWIWDVRVLTALQQNGDKAERERPIDHFAYFKDRGDAERFAKWCTDEGFTLNGEPDTNADDGRFGVEFSHFGPATIDSIHGRTVAADREATRLGGMYDGWATIVKRRPWWRFWD